MTSYHDLEKQVYEDIRATPFTRIHGRSTWRAKEKLLKEAKGPALKQRVGYDWAGQYGILAEIIGAARYALDNPTMPAYVAPAQPANTPTFLNNASAAVIKAATDANNLEKRDWAVICGFRRGVGKNICDALDLEFTPRWKMRTTATSTPSPDNTPSTSSRNIARSTPLP